MSDYSFKVSKTEEGMKAGSLIRSRMHIAAGRLSSLKFNNGLFLNGKSVHTGDTVHEGDVIKVVFPDDDCRIKPYDIPLKIMYEDQFLMVIDKPAPLPTVSSCCKEENTLENAVYAYLGCPEKFTYRPVNRLDKGTSGLLVIAKDPHCQYLLQKQLHSPDFVRRYFAVADGCPENAEGVIDAPIGNDPGSNRRYISPEGKPSVTHYRVIRTADREDCERQGDESSTSIVQVRSLIELKLETGRTHQIRVHLSSISCPVTGDYIYGAEHPGLPGRFSLHSCYVSFIHPVTGERIEISSELPPELLKLVE